MAEENINDELMRVLREQIDTTEVDTAKKKIINKPKHYSVPGF